MVRLVGLIVALTLLAPIAVAAPETGVTNDAAPDLRPVGRALASGAATAAQASGDALGAAARGAASLASEAGDALVALGHALAAGLAALGRAATAMASFLFAGLASLASLLAALGLGGARAVAAHPRESAIVAGSLTGAGLLAFLVKKTWLAAFLPLYSRLAHSEMLDNKVRASVFEHVKAVPGTHPSAIAHALGLGWGTVVYHLARLEESSLVTSRMAHHRKCYFVVGIDLDNAGRSAVAAISTDKARAIIDALRAEPGLSQKALSERLGMSQALASWHVKRLVTSGVLVATRDGRSNLLHVAEHVPVLKVAAAAAIVA